MQVEEYVLKIMNDENKPRRINLDNGLKVTRPTPHSIVPEEIYNDSKNLYTEKDVISALKKLWLQDNKVDTYLKQKDGEEISWWSTSK
jgi:hypothetical protein